MANGLVVPTQVSIHNQVPQNSMFTQSETVILKNLDSPRIHTIADEEFVVFVGSIMSEAIIALGHKNTFTNQQDRTAAQILIINNLRSYFPYYTLGDVRTAVEMGVNGDFDTDDAIITFSPARLIRWLKSYIERKNIVVCKLRKIEEQQQRKVEIEQTERENTVFLNTEFVKLCQSWDIHLGISEIEILKFNPLYLAFYEKMNVAGLIVQDLAQKWEILLKVRKWVAENVPEMEKVWQKESFFDFRNTIDTQQTFPNNYFHRKATFLSKQKCFADSMSHIMSQKESKSLLELIKW